MTDEEKAHLTAIFNEGQVAAQNGQEIPACPYSDMAEKEAWRQGHSYWHVTFNNAPNRTNLDTPDERIQTAYEEGAGE